MDGTEGNAGGIVPEEMQCKRSDGKQWRCTAASLPDKTVCAKHYHQAKKRAASSALRKAKKGYPYNSPDQHDTEVSASMSPMNSGNDGRGKEVWETAYNTPSSKKAKNMSRMDGEECSDRSSYSSEDEVLTCHQCRRNDRVNVVWCVGCNKRGYCDSCIARWYPNTTMEDIHKSCPACRGTCNCRFCFNADFLIKAKVQDMDQMTKLQYLHSLLSFVLPVLRHIYAEQCFEIEVETRSHGIKTDILRAKINADEQMCCDLCKIPIFDYHRHCTNCLYDLCLSCCRELRQASAVSMNNDPREARVSERSSQRSKDAATVTTLQPRSYELMSNHNLNLQLEDHDAVAFSQLFPKWKVSKDGTIPCGPEEAGGCGSPGLVLRRILKINWAAKLVKNAEEMVSGCKLALLDNSGIHDFSMETKTSPASGSIGWKIYQCSQRGDSNANSLYCPTSQDIKINGIGRFHKHWVGGEPIIVKHVFEHSLASSWDPMIIWRRIQEIADERMKDDIATVKVIDCSNQSEVGIDLDQFIMGYTEGSMHESGWPQTLKLKDSPSSSSLEEFISCHIPELLSNLPLIELIHFKWGVLNLASKLPHDTLPTEMGPNIVIAYGAHGKGDSVANLCINTGDLVHILMHTAGVNYHTWNSPKIDRNEKTIISNAKLLVGNAHVADPTLNLNDKFSSAYRAQEHIKQRDSGVLNLEGDEMLRNQECNGPLSDCVTENITDPLPSRKNVIGVPEKGCRPGAIWDVYRRQDVPKLNDFLRANWKEYTKSSTRPVNSVMYPVYHQPLDLNKDQKRRLKDEFRIEPWTFEQHIGEAVFIPAGCPFEVRYLQSSVQLSFDFLSPESLGESVRMAREIHSLPNDHEAKVNTLEAEKMSLYATSLAIKEVQKIALDPKFSSNVKFEDRNLTASISKNIERFKSRKIVCT